VSCVFRAAHVTKYKTVCKKGNNQNGFEEIRKMLSNPFEKL
jgi:hypothetical protein